jgi:PAS domain S-box-containing protein
LLVVPFVLQLAGTIGLVGYLSFRNGHQAVNELATQLRSEISARVKQQLQNYMETPFLINRMNATSLANQDIDLKKPEEGNRFWQQATSIPATNLIYCGSETDGSFLGVGQANDLQGRLLQVQYSNPSTSYLFHYKTLNQSGEIVATRKIGNRPYNPRHRPWYIDAKQKGRETWSEIYLDFDDFVPVITASLPVYAPHSRQLIGVCATDFLLAVELDSFLNQLEIGQSGQVFIMERSGVLVSSSTADEEALTLGQGDRIQRLLATESKNPLVRATASQLKTQFHDFQQIQSEQQLSFDLRGKQLVQVTPFRDDRGLDWLIVVVVPESDFMRHIDANTKMTVWLWVGSLLIAVEVSIFLAGWVTDPLLKLNAAAKQVAQGDWEQPFKDVQPEVMGIQRHDEVGELAQSLQEMTRQLQATFAQKEELHQELAASNDQLSQILQALPIGIVVLHPSGDGYLNQIGQQLLDMESNSELSFTQASSTYQLYRAGTDELYPPDELPMFQALQGRTMRVDDLEIRRGGKAIALEARSIPVFDAQGRVVYALSTFQDITERKWTARLLEAYNQVLERQVQERTIALEQEIAERKQIELDLKQRKQQFRTLVDHAPDIIMRLNSEGRYLYINPTVEGQTGIPASEFIGKTLDQFGMSAALVEQWRCVIQQVFESGKPQMLEYEVPTATGLKFYASRVVPEFASDGSVQSVLAIARDISELKQTEATLRQSEAQNQAILSAIPDLMYSVSADGIFLGYSRTTQFADLVASEINPIGHPLMDLLPTHIAQRHLSYIQQALTTGKAQTYEQEIYVDNKLQYEEVRVTPSGEAKALMIIRDISDRKRMEVELQNQQIFLRSVIDVCPYPIFVKDKTGCFVTLNQAAAAIYGRTVEELVGKRDIDFNANGHQVRQFLQSNEDVMADRKTKIFPDQSIVNAQGETRWYQTVIAPFIQDGEEIKGVIGASSDITERKQVEVALKQAKEAAEAANHAKSTFLSSMSHELRTPLNAILGFAQIMARDPACTSEQRYNLQIINRSGEHLLGLINSVLDLSKIEAGRMELIETSFNLHHLVDMVATMLYERAISKGLQLQIKIAPNVPQQIAADPSKLRQILINLVGNAIKFTDRGKITIHVQSNYDISSQSHLAAKSSLLFPTPIVLRFEVEDTGVGIPTADLDKIFDAFEQAGSGKTLTEGTGLGLTLTRRFVELMGGEISVQSMVGQGSRFTVEIPVRFANFNPTENVQSPDAIISLLPNQPIYRILIVDDQRDNRELVVKLLEPMGFIVDRAASGQEAIEQWQQHRPHLILMDIQMAALSGLETTQKIRAQEQTLTAHSPTRIIALSASIRQDDRTQAAAVGCDDFLQKPFCTIDLFDKLSHHLHLSYTFTEPDRNFAGPICHPAPARLLHPELLETISPDWIEQLREASLVGDDAEVFSLLEQLTPEHECLTAGLRDLACQFQFDRILSLLETPLTPDP